MALIVAEQRQLQIVADRPHFSLVVVRRHWYFAEVQIGNMRELAAAVRAERKRLGLSQSALAEKVGVGRDWIIGLEKGKATAEIGLVLRTLRSLGLTVRLGSTSEVHPPSRINLNELLGDHLEKR
jgi:HTH-type transcriptional regulator/antitoxin HipB